MSRRLSLRAGAIVATAASAGHRLVHGRSPYREAGMAHVARLGIRIGKTAVAPQGRHRGCCRVAIGWIAGLMASRLVTGMGAHGYPDVVPASGKECVGSVAVVAGAGQHHARVVAARPACGYPAVMAGGALSRNCSTVIVFRTHEGIGIEVAGFAWRIGRDVVGRLRHCNDAPAQSMALVAIPGCPLEYACDVA